MALQLRQNLKLTQQLVMTPQLQQAIKLLQYSRQELVETVQQVLMENPLLEERQVQEDTKENDSKIEENKNTNEFKEIKVEEKNLVQNAEWDDYLGVFSSSSKSSFEREIPEDSVSYEAFCATRPTLESHLLWQLHLSDLTSKEMDIGDTIIGNLEDNGYLNIPLEDVADWNNVSVPEVKNVLKKIQEFDPVGIASRDLKECLRVQLKVLGEDDPLLIDLINNHLYDLQEKKFQALAKKLSVSLKKIHDYFRVIQNLDPKPGSSFGSGNIIYISPDAYVYNYGDDFVIFLNDDDLPDLQINHYYLEKLGNKKGKDKEYLQEQMREATWLMKSIQQRQRTLYKVLESILKFQREFFENGVTHLKPLVLKDIADDIEMHESTVSRITTNKYVSTPYGIFELKYFFNSGLGVDSGGQVASESVKASIRKFVSEEDPGKPLSDKKLVDLLNQQLQVRIARRTVAKYREAMGIPSSTKRKAF